MSRKDDEDQDTSFGLTITEPRKLGATPTVKEVLESDAETAENILQALHLGWTQVRNLSGLCKLAETTFKAMEARRKLLCMPYGAETKRSGSDIVVPLD